MKIKKNEKNKDKFIISLHTETKSENFIFYYLNESGDTLFANNIIGTGSSLANITFEFTSFNH